jgi:hypothetical protein
MREKRTAHETCASYIFALKSCHTITGLSIQGKEEKGNGIHQKAIRLIMCHSRWFKGGGHQMSERDSYRTEMMSSSSLILAPFSSISSVNVCSEIAYSVPDRTPVGYTKVKTQIYF